MPTPHAYTLGQNATKDKILLFTSKHSKTYVLLTFHLMKCIDFCLFVCLFVSVPSEINARGPEAKRAYENALRNGKVKVYRGRIMLIGQDRAGKTSLKKNLLGLPFDPQEQSTDGIEVDPSKFEYDIDQVKNWKRTDGKLGVSHFVDDLAKMVAGKLKEEETSNAQKTEDDDKHQVVKIMYSIETKNVSKCF